MQNNKLERAKQFMMFDALSGLKEALLEQEKEIENKKTLNQEKEEEINRILNSIKVGDDILVSYYEDRTFNNIRGKIKKISFDTGKIFLEDKELSVINIVDIKIL